MVNYTHKVPHFSKRKFRLLLKLFSQELTAVQAANISGLNRNTVNLHYKRIRQKILKNAKQNSLKNADHVQIDETYFACKKQFFKQFELPAEEVTVLGLATACGKVRFEVIQKTNHACILPIIMESCAPGAVIYTDSHKVYECLKKLEFKHSAINHNEDEYARYEGGNCITTNRAEGMFGCLKVWLVKFRGLRVEDYELYVKEFEWRFNNRRIDLYKLLLKMYRAKDKI